MHNIFIEWQNMLRQNIQKIQINKQTNKQKTKQNPPPKKKKPKLTEQQKKMKTYVEFNID